MFRATSALFIPLAILHIISLTSGDECNEDICGAIVSKCAIMQSCKCERKDVTCYRECIACMGNKHFEKCCNCVGLCPKLGAQNVPPLSQKSHVEDFDGVPELFDVLVSSPADSLEYIWNIFTVTIDLDEVISKKHRKQDVQREVMNCTVVYFDNCVSWNKCRQSCRSTGASGYRWFHDGCCECFGSRCINYGVNESHCRHCPEPGDEDEDEFEIANDEDYFYEFELLDGNLADTKPIS